MCVGSWAGVAYLHYTVLMSPKKDEIAVHCCDPALSVLLVDVSKRLLGSIDLQSIFGHFTFLAKIFCSFWFFC